MGIKVKREATKERKNALGRKVVVNRNASGNEAVSKTRTVYSKSGGVISEKKSYKDRGSVAGKLLERKVDKSIAKRDRANEKQESLRRKESIKKAAAEGSRVGGSKIDQKISENRNPYKFTDVKNYASGKTKQATNPKTGLVTNVRRSGMVKSFVDPSTGESQVYRPRVIGSPSALKKETNAQGITTTYKRSGEIKRVK